VEGKTVIPTATEQQTSNKIQTKVSNDIPKFLESIIIKDPPSEYEFMIEPSSISAYDLDMVKLTAQFVARNGRQFLTSLMSKEARNPQFDFLKPAHGLFNYFTATNCIGPTVPKPTTSTYSSTAKTIQKPPQLSEKPEWNLNGQAIPLTLPITDPISVIKAKLFDLLGGMPTCL